MPANILLWYSELRVLKICVPPEEPFFSIPMVVATKKRRSKLRKKEEIQVFGNDALEKDETWQLTWLHGIWRDQIKLLQDFYIFVGEQPAVVKRAERCKYMLVVLQPLLVPSRPRNKNGEVINYNRFPALSIPLSLYRDERSQYDLSLVGRQGLNFTYCLNISGDFTLLQSATVEEYIKVGFDTIVDLFIKLLCEEGYDFTAQKYRLLCYMLVMDYCYVALDFEKELKRIRNLGEPLHEVVMKDGTVLKLREECIVAPEVLFNPGLVGMDGDNIMSLFEHTDSQPWSSTFVFTGGCAPRLRGLGERIQQEIMNNQNVDTRIKIVESNVLEDAPRWYEWEFNNS